MQFAEWCLSSSERKTNTPDRPFSLFEGGTLTILCGNDAIKLISPTHTHIRTYIQHTHTHSHTHTHTHTTHTYNTHTPHPHTQHNTPLHTQHTYPHPHTHRAGREHLLVCGPAEWCRGMSLPWTRTTSSERDSGTESIMILYNAIRTAICTITQIIHADVGF